MKLSTKVALREAMPQRLDEELESMDEEQALDEIMQSPMALEKLDDYSR